MYGLGSKFQFSKTNIYKQPDVSLSRSATLKELVSIGSGTIVGANTIIFSSVIGKNCIIGANIKISNAFIFDNVVIEDDCVLSQCMIAFNAVIKKGVTITKGCMLGSDIQVGPNITLPPMTRICAELNNCDDSSEKSGSVLNWNHVDDDIDLGLEACGFVYNEDLDTDDDPRNIQIGSMGAEYLNLSGDVADSEISAELHYGSEEGDSIYDILTLGWETEVKQTIDRALLENHDVDIAALELNTLKMAFNITFADLRLIVIPGILDCVPPSKGVDHMKTVNLN